MFADPERENRAERFFSLCTPGSVRKIAPLYFRTPDKLYVKTYRAFDIKIMQTLSHFLSSPFLSDIFYDRNR
jgi:hypothetical protein